MKAFISLPGGGQAVYTGSGLAYYRHADWLGSSRLASTPSRTVYFSGAYAPYGEDYAKTTGSTDLSFTGQNQDTLSGLYDFMFRRYSPVQGRWISPDPAGMAAVDPTNPQTWNRYAYVGNNPLGFIDALGLANETVPTCPHDSEDYCVDVTASDPGGAAYDPDGCYDVYSGGAYMGNTCDYTPTTDGKQPPEHVDNTKPQAPKNKCPGKITSVINSALIDGAGTGPVAAARLLAMATGHVVTLGVDLSGGFTIGTLGITAHGGYALAFDRAGNIGVIKTTGVGGGFGADLAATGQLGFLRETSVLSLESGGSTVNTSIGGGDGVQGQVGSDLNGNVTLSVGPGAGITSSSTVDISKVYVVACKT